MKQEKKIVRIGGLARPNKRPRKKKLGDMTMREVLASAKMTTEQAIARLRMFGRR